MSIRSIIATATVLSSALLGARADPVPNTPDTGITGKTCTITWAEDTTGNWGETAIELMTGDNQAMVHLTSEYYILCCRWSQLFVVMEVVLAPEP